MKFIKFFLFIFIYNSIVHISANTYYVDINNPVANDNNPGTAVLPWRTAFKGFYSGQAGDTVYFMSGVYRQDQLSLNNAGGSVDSRINFKAFPGEEVIITSLRLRNNTTDWEPVAGYPNIYSTNMSTPILTLSSIIQCSQNSVPLRLMPYLNSSVNAGPEVLTGPGEWSRDIDTGKIYVWLKDNLNPTINSIHMEIGEYNYPGDRATLFGFRNLNYTTFEGLTFEGGYYPIAISGDYCEIKNCTMRNYYGHVKVYGTRAPYTFNSLHGLIEGCDIYNYSELGMGIDVTGGDYWTIRNNNIHDSEGLGIMIKNNSIGVIVENNIIHDIDSSETPYGYLGITIGGQSFGGYPDEAVDVIVRNNIFYNLNGGHVVMFMASTDCAFYNNIIYNSNVTDGLVVFSLSNPNEETYNNKNPIIKNNIFSNNIISADRLYTEWNLGCVVNLTSDCNLIDFTPTYQVQGLSGNDIQSVFDSPVFVDAVNADFHPVPISPVIDSGCDLSGLVDFDIDGVSRPLNGSWDIGPFEYETNCTATIPTNLLVSNITISSAIINWDEVLNATYDIRYKETVNASWITISDISELINTLTGLLGNTEYEVQVRSKCVDNSSYSNSVIFTTIDPVANVSNVNYFKKLNIYPNPNDGKLNISFLTSDLDDVKIQIYTNLGQIIFNKKYSKNKNEFIKQIDLSNLSNGIYLIKITDKLLSINKTIILK